MEYQKFWNAVAAGYRQLDRIRAKSDGDGRYDKMDIRAMIEAIAEDLNMMPSQQHTGERVDIRDNDYTCGVKRKEENSTDERSEKYLELMKHAALLLQVHNFVTKNGYTLADLFDFASR